MEKWISAAISFLFAVNLVHADGPRCDAAANDMSVPASSRAMIARGCEKMRVYATCNRLADDRKMLGDKRKNFMQNCTGQGSTGRR